MISPEILRKLVPNRFPEDDFKASLDPYRFPRDHFNHPDFETEWWYYTGNVDSIEDRRFGFELTFFRRAADRNQTKPSLWQVNDVWLAQNRPEADRGLEMDVAPHGAVLVKLHPIAAKPAS